MSQSYFKYITNNGNDIEVPINTRKVGFKNV